MSDNPLTPPASSPAQQIPISGSPRRESSLAQSPSRASTTARLATPVSGTPVPGSPPGPRAGAASIPHNADQQGTQTPLAGATGSSVPGPGTSSLSQALRGKLGQESPSRSPAQRDSASARVG